MFWCRLILLTRTPFRDKCLDLLYKSILVSSKDRSQLFDMSCALRGFIRLFVGNEDDTKSNQSIDVHPRKFDILPFSSDGPNNNQSSWNNNHTSGRGKLSLESVTQMNFLSITGIFWENFSVYFRKSSKDLRDQLAEIIFTNQFLLSTRKFLVKIWKSNGWIYFKGRRNNFSS